MLHSTYMECHFLNATFEYNIQAVRISDVHLYDRPTTREHTYDNLLALMNMQRMEKSSPEK